MSKSSNKSLLAERAASAILAFTIGVYIAWKGFFPFEPWLRNAFIGVDAIFLQVNQEVFGDSSDVWLELPDGESVETGVTRYDPAKSAGGLTLVTASQGAHLVNMDGDVVHSWQIEYDTLPNRESAVTGAGDRVRLYWQRAHLFADGNILALVNQTNASPAGLAIMLLDREANPIWVRHGHYHHDFDIDTRGNIYVLDQQIRPDPPENLSKLEGPILDEGISVISPNGEVIKRVSIIDAFSNSVYAALIDRSVVMNKLHWGDYTHSNNVDVADERVAQRFDFVEAGQVLISLREVDVIAVLDVQQEKIVWAMRGSWSRQHDPDFLDNGNMLIFDNRGDWARGGSSRVIELNPRTQELVWQYPKPTQKRLWSYIRGESQVLPNGNFLINEFWQRRLIEVTREGDIAWEYRCPFRHPDDPSLICRTMSSRRYSAGDLRFQFSSRRTHQDVRADIDRIQQRMN